MSIPITVGVTGHRDLCPEELPILRELVHRELEKIKNACPNSELILLSSLAAGADELCADEAIRLGYKLVVPLPVEPELFRKDFTEDEAAELDRLMALADEVFVAPPYEEQTENRRDFCFRQAGIYVAAHSHVLLAIWDGTPRKPNGCGTAEAVDFMLNRSYEKNAPVLSGAEVAVIHITASRISKPDRLTPRCELLENIPGALEDILGKTDEFNKDCRLTAECEEKSFSAEDDTLSRLETCEKQGSIVSARFQKKYLTSLGLLSSFGVLLVMSYLLYDEAELMWMLLVYAATLVLYYSVYKRIVHGKYHEKYINCRLFTEALRVQTYLCRAGLNSNAAGYFTQTQQQDTLWIKSAINVLYTEPVKTLEKTEDVIAEWIDDQMNYNISAGKRNGNSSSLAGRISQTLLISTVVLFAAVLVLEYFVRPFMDSEWLTISWRSWFKIFWGSISAVALFLSGYYGNLSLDRKTEDNEKMAAMFCASQKELNNPNLDCSKLALELAREEIIENGSWASYCKENKPMFSL